jgi:hypothetical protein
MLYWQSSCCRFDFPSDTIIYSEDPTDVARLASDPLFESLPAIPEAKTRIFRKSPLAWEKLQPFITPGIFIGPYGPPEEPGIIVFMHERTTASGSRRLVGVGINVKNHNDPTTPIPSTRLSIVIKQIEMGTLRAGPTISRGGMSMGQGMRHLDPGVNDDIDTAFSPGALRFFAGRPDPEDPATFIIPWEFAGTRYTMRGTIHDDSDPAAEGSFYEPVTLHDCP